MTETNYETVAAKLTTDIDKLRRKVSAIDQKRAPLSLDVRLGDADARKTLNELNDARNARLTEIADLEAALAEARRRIGEVKTAAAAEAERQRAETALPIAQRIAEIGKEQDAVAARYCELHTQAEELFEKLTRLGVPVPSRDLRRVNRHRAHDASFAAIDNVSRPQRSFERSHYSSLYRGWAQMSQNWINSKINTNNDADAA
jgi:hypothetical protein